MKVLVINSGSSSLKYKLFTLEDGPDSHGETVAASGLVERIGTEEGHVAHTVAPGTDRAAKTELTTPIRDHQQGLAMVINLLMDPKQGVIRDQNEISGVGHRVVHGGEQFSDPVLVDEDVVRAIQDTVPLAPLHNPPNLAGIRTAMELFSHAPHVAVFDTAFFQTMPARAYLYAVPYDYYEQLGVRRYGFHGTSHRFVSSECARLMGKPLEKLNCITVHLGNGCSMAAIKNGRAVDTSLGMTPLAGLVMGTRCGDLDPAVLAYLHREKGLSVQELDAVLNKESGLMGICGLNDMRDIHAAIEQGGDQGRRARLALDMACYRNRKYIGEYMAVLGRTDAVVFTAGIGENDDIVRAESLRGLEELGLKLDPEKNAGRVKQPKAVHAQDSEVAVWVIPTDEELEIARQTRSVLQAMTPPATAELNELSLPA